MMQEIFPKVQETLAGALGVEAEEVAHSHSSRRSKT